MRQLLPFVLSFSLLQPTSPAPLSDRTATLVSPSWIASVERSIVLVTYEEHLCTGFVVDAARGWVLTARHCIEEEVPVFVEHVPSTIVAVSPVFALLSIPLMERPPLDLRKDRIPVGESVVSFGYGYGWMQVVQRHIASWKDGDIFLDAPVAPGMSGGPIVDLAGKVVGLNQAVDPNRTLTQACGVDEMRDFLKSVR